MDFRNYCAFDVTDDDDAFAATASELMPAGRSRVWNNAVMELGGVACGKTPKCDEAGCPWREWCHAYQTGDFTAPDVPTQPEFESSRRQMRGRVISVLKEYDELTLNELGPRVRVDYAPGGVLAEGEGSSGESSESDGEYGCEWLGGLLADLVDDGLVELAESDEGTVARLRR